MVSSKPSLHVISDGNINKFQQNKPSKLDQMNKLDEEKKHKIAKNKPVMRWTKWTEKLNARNTEQMRKQTAKKEKNEMNKRNRKG